MKNYMKLIAATGLLTITLASCEKSPLESVLPTSEIDKSSSMNVKLTDAPANYSALNLTIESVDVYHQDSGWIELSSESQEVDILSLTNGVTTEIGSNVDMSSGHYTKLRIDFADQAELGLHAAGDLGVFQLSANAEAQMAWNNSSSIEIDISEQLESGSVSTIVLDFDVAKSVIETGTSYVLDPHVSVIADDNTGVEGADIEFRHAAILVLNKADDLEASGYANADGEFQIAGLANGSYNIQIESMNEATGLTETTTFEDVTITEGEFTLLSGIQ